MKRGKFILTLCIILILSLSTIVFAVKTAPGHSANEIGGTEITDRIFQNLIYSFPNSIGIGTTTPTQKLHVEGNVNITGNLYVSGQQITSGSSGGCTLLANSTAGGSVTMNNSLCKSEQGCTIKLREFYSGMIYGSSFGDISYGLSNHDAWISTYIDSSSGAGYNSGSDGDTTWTVISNTNSCTLYDDLGSADSSTWVLTASGGRICYTYVCN